MGSVQDRLHMYEWSLVDSWLLGSTVPFDKCSGLGIKLVQIVLMGVDFRQAKIP